MIASFANQTALLGLIVAGTDKWCLLLTSVLTVLSILNCFDTIQTPSWCFAALIVAIIVRIISILINSDEALIAIVWKKVAAIARWRCSDQRT